MSDAEKHLSFQEAWERDQARKADLRRRQERHQAQVRERRDRELIDAAAARNRERYEARFRGDPGGNTGIDEVLRNAAIAAAQAEARERQERAALRKRIAARDFEWEFRNALGGVWSGVQAVFAVVFLLFFCAMVQYVGDYLKGLF